MPNLYNSQDAQVGIYHTHDVAVNLQRSSFPATQARLRPSGSGKFFSLLDMKSQGSIMLNSKYDYWQVSTMVYPSCTTTVAAPAGATNQVMTLTVTDAANILANDVLMVSDTGEQMLVVSVTANTTINVVRGITASGAAPAIPANVILTKVSNSFEEGSLRPIPITNEGMDITNTCQIFRNTYSLTNSQAAIKEAMPGSSLAGSVLKNQMIAAEQHNRDIETALLHGQYYVGQRGGQPLHTMMGFKGMIETYAPQNVMALGPTTTYTQLLTAVDVVYDQTSSESDALNRVIMTGSRGAKIINAIIRKAGVVTIDAHNSSTSFGLVYKSFTTDRGTYHVMENPSFNTDPQLSATLYIMDIPTMDVTYLRKTMENRFNIDANNKIQVVANDSGIDAQGGTYTTELSLRMTAPTSCGIITGLTEAACDQC